MPKETRIALGMDKPQLWVSVTQTNGKLLELIWAARWLLMR